jgi:menaquinone-dependent protoporphyrinogen oxidase
VTVLVVYASKHGSTAEIAEAIGATLRDSGFDVDVSAAADAPDPAAYDAVVLGSAIYAGSWMKDALDFATAHAGAIATRPSWLFSSGPLGEPEPMPEEQPAELPELIGSLRPRWHTLFAGRYDPERLGFGERMVMKAVKAEPGDYRNWDRIGAWTEEIAAALAQP